MSGEDVSEEDGGSPAPRSASDRVPALAALLGRVQRALGRAAHATGRGYRGLLRRIQPSSLLVPLALGLALRLALAPFTSWTHDVYFFYRPVQDLLGGLGPYDTSFYTYPPLWAYTLFPPLALLGFLADPATFGTLVPSMGPVAHLTGMLAPTVTAPLFNLALKLPLLGADLGVGLLLWRWASASLGRTKGVQAFALWFLNPLVLWTQAAHGQFDVLPAFFTLAAVLLLLARRPFLGGSALGVATLFKLYPFFLLLPAAFLAVLQARHRDANRPTLARALAVLLLAAGWAAVVLGFGLPLLGTRFVEAIFVRRAQFTAVGGFSPLFFLALDVWQRIPLGQALVLPLPGVVFPWSLLLPVIVPAVAGLAILRARRQADRGADPPETALYLVVVTLVALYSALVLVNPQHLLWILPFLVLASVRWPGTAPLTLFVSLMGLLFFLSLQGPAAFWYPLAVHTPLLSPEDLNGQVTAYWALPGLLSSRLQQDLIFATSGSGYVALLFLARRIHRAYPGPSRAVPPSAQPDGPSRPSPALGLPKVLAAGVALLLVSQALVLLPGLPAPGSVEEVTIDEEGPGVAVALRGHAAYAASYRVAILGLDALPRDGPIYVYHDDRYPVSNTSRAALFGLVDHLRSHLRLAGHPAAVEMADTPRLLALLQGPPAVVVFAATALPRDVLFPDPTLLRDWLEAGGSLVWTGGPLGEYMGLPTGELVWLPVDHPGQVWGPERILGYPLGNGTGEEVATSPTVWSRGLGLSYPLARWGAPTEVVLERGGLVLGPVTQEAVPRTSLALLPVGNGTVLLFGDAPKPAFGFSAEDVVARDLARLLVAGVLPGPAPGGLHLLASARVRTGPAEAVRLALPVVPVDGTTHLRVAIFSEVDFDPLVTAMTLPLA